MTLGAFLAPQNWESFADGRQSAGSKHGIAHETNWHDLLPTLCLVSVQSRVYRDSLALDFVGKGNAPNRTRDSPIPIVDAMVDPLRCTKHKLSKIQRH